MPSQLLLEKKMRKAQKDSAKEAERISELKELTKPVSLEAGIERNTISKGLLLTKTAIADGAAHDIDLQSKLIGELIGNSIRLVIDNKSGAALTPPRFAQEMFELKLNTDDGNHQVCTMTHETMMYPLRFLDKEVLDRLKLGFESTEEELTNGIPNGASRTYYIPIYCPFVLNDCFMQAASKRITYEITFNKKAWGKINEVEVDVVGEDGETTTTIVNVAEGHPELKGLDMISRHRFYSDNQMQSMRKYYRNNDQNYSFRNYIVSNPTAVITAGEPFDVELTGLKSTQSSEIMLQLWKNGTRVSDFGNYIESFDIELDEKSIMATTAINSTYNEIVLGAAHEYQPVIGDVNDPWTTISFTSSNAADYADGSINGAYEFSGDEVLKIKVKDTLPDTGYTLRIYNGKIEHIVSIGGLFKRTGRD